MGCENEAMNKRDNERLGPHTVSYCQTLNRLIIDGQTQLTYQENKEGERPNLNIALNKLSLKS